MIPIKEAITIFEQYKIDQIRNSDLIKFESEYNLSGFSASEYIIGKIKEWVAYEANGYGIFKPKNNLLSYLKKNYHSLDEELYINEGLSLYGRKVSYFIGIPQATDEYEEIYKWNYYSDNENKQFTDLFENYDYEEIYNPSTNYTVMGDKVTNIITYMDICVDNTEFKAFLESEFINAPPSKYGELINKTLEKYVNKVDEVFRITIEKKKKLLDFNKEELSPNEYVFIKSADPYIPNEYVYIPSEWSLTKDLPGIDKDGVKTLDEFIDEHIKRQIKYNKTL